MPISQEEHLNYVSSVVVYIEYRGNEPHRQVGVDRVIDTSGSLMVRMLAQGWQEVHV